MTRLTCIVPAYNEESRIAAVLASVVGHPLIDEVLVIDDGSKDNTAAVVETVAGARLIRMPQNRGKTWAVTVGIEQAQGSNILLVDADLLGLEEWHLSALIEPVLAGQADISISLRSNAPRIWRAIGLDYISGERVMSRDRLVPHIAAMRALPRFGFEVFLNSLLIRDRARVAVVRWPGVQSPFKNVKYGWKKGVIADIKMISDMCRSVPPWGLLAQIVKMRRQRVTLPQ